MGYPEQRGGEGTQNSGEMGMGYPEQRGDGGGGGQYRVNGVVELCGFVELENPWLPFLLFFC